MVRLICILIGYVFGLFQTGYLYGRYKKIDIRKHGSGNAGTTNALRTLGIKAGLLTFGGDCLKCILAIVVVRMLFRNSYGDILPLLSMYAGAGAILGHNYPFYLNFKGGKGIAATAGIVLATSLYLVPIPLVLFVSALLLTRYVSVGSLAVVISFAIETIVFGEMGKLGMVPAARYELYGVLIFLTILALWRHRENIVRLIKGTERPMWGSRSKQEEVK